MYALFENSVKSLDWIKFIQMLIIELNKREKPYQLVYDNLGVHYNRAAKALIFDKHSNIKTPNYGYEFNLIELVF